MARPRKSKTITDPNLEAVEVIEEKPIPLRMPVCPLRSAVIYPGMVMPVDAGRPVSITPINAAFEGDKYILTVAQHNKDVDAPKAGDMNMIGTVCSILRMRKNPDGTVQMLIQATRRARVKKFHMGDYIEASIELLEDEPGDPREVQALKRELQTKFEAAIKSGKFINPENVQFIQSLEDPGQIADRIANDLDFKLEDRQKVLEAVNVAERIKKVLVLLDGELELIDMQKRIQMQVKEEIDRNQREYFLREQMKAIQRELRGEDDDSDEVEVFRKKIDALELATEVRSEIDREMSRMARMHPDSAEASVIRTYLTWITELPWNARSDDQLKIDDAEKILEEDHYGLEKVKDRVLEFLAVRQLRKQRVLKGELEANAVNKGPILVFVGPPGVGKTSIAKHRCASGPHHSRFENRRHQKSRVPLGRDRQARLELPGRSKFRAARGARSGTKRNFRRSLFGRAIRPFGSDVHCHRELPGTNSRATLGPHGIHRIQFVH
jgi:ATP-dependent Lon protease